MMMPLSTCTPGLTDVFTSPASISSTIWGKKPQVIENALNVTPASLRADNVTIVPSAVPPSHVPGAPKDRQPSLQLLLLSQHCFCQQLSPRPPTCSLQVKNHQAEIPSFYFFFFFWRFAKQANVRLHSWARATTEIKQNRPEGRQHFVGTGGKAKASPPGWAERKGWWATTGGSEEQAASGLPAKRKPSTHLPSACCIYLDLGDSDVPCVLWSCCTTRNCHPARSSDPRAADPCLAQGAPCSHHVWGCNPAGKVIK